ncbi:Retrovirus-related Pol polyprotein from transposon 17.6 [Cucumis melo var. makuwa]|uniref:Retrovirus-related Pol polyprotein from transposon 17.6 n=1 Tax=Cucumis melo var. makuwa TaxID=1194695 RepID=A0A5D3BTH0_CUCMM|nr:Retrovirus-related Pol polyprotein from transposon 17.6 [Cucumis melo var. makuwa]
MCLNDEEIKFIVANIMKFPIDAASCNIIESLGRDYCEEEAFFELFNTEEFFEEEDPKLDEGHVGTVHVQRRLNPTMKEVIMKGIAKWLDAWGNICNCRYLEEVLEKWEETCLVINLEKCHFMVRKGIVLGHKISNVGLKVDPPKTDLVSKLPPPSDVKPLNSFLNYTTTEKELLAVVFIIEKFKSYIIGSKVTVHSSDSMSRYLMAKKDAKTWLTRWTKEVYQALGTRPLPGKWVKHFGRGTLNTTNVYKLYDVVGPTQYSHRLCRSGAHPALTTASLLRSTLNVNNGI